MSSILSIAATHENFHPTTGIVVRAYTLSVDQLPDGNQWALSFIGHVSNMVENSLTVSVIVGDSPTDTSGTVIVSKVIASGENGFFTSNEVEIDPTSLFGSVVKYVKICAFYSGSTAPHFNSETLFITGTVHIPTPVGLSNIELLTHNSVALTFSKTLLNNEVLKNTSTYSIVPVTTGNTVNITSVLTGKDRYTNKVILLFTDPTLGSAYNLTIQPTVTYPDNTQPDLPITFQFQIRHTKMDRVLQRMPNIYDTTPTTTLRWVLQAVSQSDERIGGTQSDLLGVLT